MKSAFILHGYNGDTLYTFGPWLRQKFEELGYDVYSPSFPIRLLSSYENWSSIFDPYLKYINDETIVIAHSISNPFILKYIASHNIKIKLYISVAGFCELFNVPGRQDLNEAFRRFAISDEEIEKSKILIKNRYSLYSDNDYVVPFNILENFSKKIDSIPVLMPGAGHMGKREKVTEIEKLIDIVKRF